MKIDGDDLDAPLPPLDDDEHDGETGDDGSDDLDALPDQDGDPLDDAASGADEVDERLEAPDGEGAEGEDDGAKTDVGDLDADFHEPDIGDPVEADSTGAAEADPDLDDEPESEDDTGAEGTNDEADQMIEGDLPALDAGDDGEFEDELLREAGLVEDPREERPPTLGAAAWRERKDLRRATPLAGRPFGTIDAISFDPRAPETMIGATLNKRLFISRDAGRTATVSDGWVELFAGSQAASEDAPLVVSLSRLRGTIVVAQGNVVAESSNLGEAWRKIAPPRGSVVAMTECPDGSLAALAVDARSSWLCTTADGHTWSARELTLPTARPGAASRVWLACAGDAVAVGDTAGVAVSRDGGRSFDRVAGSVFATAGVFVGDDTAAPLVVAVSYEPGRGSALVRIDDGGARDIVAHVGAGMDPGEDEEDAPADPGAPIALAWDGALVWGAGIFGITAWQMPAATAARVRQER